MDSISYSGHDDNLSGEPIGELLQHMDWLRGLARRIVGREAVAEDLAQQTWIDALALARKPSAKLPTGSHVRPWLARVLRNNARARYRSDARRAERERLAARPEQADCIEAHQQLVLLGHRELVNSILSLNDDQRRVLVARYWYDLTPREIAARENIPLATVRSRLSRAQQHLRERLARSERSSLAVACFAHPRVTLQSTKALSTALGASLMMNKYGLAAAAALLLFASYLGLRPAPSHEVSTQTITSVEDDVDWIAGETVPLLDVSPVPSRRDALDPTEPEAAAWKVDRDTDLHGRVTNAALQPVAGARIFVFETRAHQSPGSWKVAAPAPTPHGSTTSDSQGRYKVALDPGRYYDIQAVPPTAATRLAPKWRQQCQAGELADFILGEASSISGRVTLDGVGVPDVEVVIGPETPYFERPRNKVARARTDRHGSYQLNGLAQGRYTLFARSTEVVVPPSITLDLYERRIEQDIFVSQGRPVAGRIVDAATGAAIVGATVRAGDSTERVACGQDGRFRIPSFRETEVWGNPASTVVIGEAPGYTPASAQVPLGSADPAALEIRLAKGVTAIGRIVDSHGRPCPDAVVMVYKARPRGKSAPRSLRCEGEVRSDGTFVVPGVEPGGRFTGATALHVTAPGHGAVITPLEIPADATGNHDCGEVTLKASLSIGGRVVDSNGRPFPHAMVLITQHIYDAGLKSQNPPLQVLEGTLCTLIVASDDLGRFRVRQLAEGQVTVIARAPARSGARAEATVLLDSERSDPCVELVLPAGESLSGCVVDQHGEGVAGAWIYLFGSGQHTHTIADENGRFEASGLNRGSYSLAVDISLLRRRGHAFIDPLRPSASTGTDDTRIVLSTGDPFRCVITRGRDEQSRAVQITLTDRQTSRQFSEWSDGLGVIETVLPAGSTFDIYYARDANTDPMLVAEEVDPSAGEFALHLD